MQHATYLHVCESMSVLLSVSSFQRISVTLDFIFFLFIWFDLDGGKLTNVTRPSKIRFQFVTRCRPISALSVALFVQPLDDSVLDSLSLSLSLSSSLFIFECRTYFFFAAGRSVCPGRRFRLPPARLSSPRVGGDCGSFFFDGGCLPLFFCPSRRRIVIEIDAVFIRSNRFDWLSVCFFYGGYRFVGVRLQSLVALFDSLSARRIRVSSWIDVMIQ